MKYPRISIVTPSYNQGQFLEETIRSVISQNYANLEYIIIDGGSTDNSMEIIKKYESDLAYWVSEPDEGQSHAINKGMRLATGDIAAYLCSDDYYEKETFNIVSKVFKLNKVDLVYGACNFVDEGGRVFRVKKRESFSRKKLLNHNYLWQPTVFFRREILEELGFFDESLHFAMDYDFWLRASGSYQFMSIECVLANYRFQSSSKSVSQTREQLREAYSVAQKYGGGGIGSIIRHFYLWPLKSILRGKYVANLANLL